VTDDEEVVLDGSALLALLHAEPGHARVAATIPRSHMSSVNLAEVVASLAEHGVPDRAIRMAVGGLGIAFHSFDEEGALQTGLLRPATQSFGLSLGDRACLALGRSLGFRVLTADRAWLSLELGVAIEIIR